MYKPSSLLKLPHVTHVIFRAGYDAVAVVADITRKYLLSVTLQ